MTTRSYSDLQTIGRCPMKYRYRNVLKIQRRRRDTSLSLGIMAHRLLMAHYLSVRDEPGSHFGMLHHWTEEISALREEGTRYLFQDEAIEFEALLNQALEIVSRYIEQADDEGWEILHVEEQFSFDVEIDGKTYTITVTPDLVVRDRNGYVWIIDHKTTQAIPTGLPFTDLQSAVYLLAVSTVYPETRGFIFNYLRKKVPTEPRLNKTKTDGIYKVHDLKRVDTTFEMLRDFLTEEAPELLDHPEHKARLAELREKNNFFGREQLYVGEAETRSTLEDLRRMVLMADLVDEHELYYRVYQKTGVTSCERCEYRSVCLAEWHEADVQRVLDEEYQERDESHKEYDTEDEE